MTIFPVLAAFQRVGAYHEHSLLAMQVLLSRNCRRLQSCSTQIQLSDSLPDPQRLSQADSGLVSVLWLQSAGLQSPSGSSSKRQQASMIFAPWHSGWHQRQVVQYSVMLSLVVYFQPNRIHRHTIRNCHIAGLLRHLMIAYNYTLADHLPQRRSLQAMSQCIYAASANFVVLCLYRAPYQM